MTATKVSSNVDIEKLKAEKRLTACKCKIEGCENIGNWDNKSKNFYLLKGFCPMHYQKDRKYGDPLASFEDGRAKHPLYSTWYKIRDRITNEKCPAYPDYGGRGLKMEKSWIPNIVGFWQFLKDIAYLGDRPEGYSLDRKDNELGYLIGNLRWANQHQQSANQRSNNEIVGISFEVTANRWKAYLRVNDKRLQKNFKTQDEAAEQRKAWEIEYKIYE